MHNSVLALGTPADIPEGAAVEARVVDETTNDDLDRIPSLYDRLMSAVGKAKALPVAAARNHHHYPYDLQEVRPVFADTAFYITRRLASDRPLTDCITFVIMRRQDLTEALAPDHHFRQAGFAIHLGPENGQCGPDCDAHDPDAPQRADAPRPA